MKSTFDLTAAQTDAELQRRKIVNPEAKCENCAVRYCNRNLISCTNIFGHYYRATVQP